MKHPAIQLVTSLFAASALLAAVAAHATDVADKPLKAGVLAKPNVIFGLDDSGSMDSEVLLPNNDGAFWWDFTAGTGWSASGVMHFNNAGNANNQWRKMVYLFPNGTGTGNRVYGDDADAHFAVPATAQFGFLRSHEYNPLYYNPTVTYNPWSPAQAPGSPYGNVSTTAAKSHPVYGTGVLDVSIDKARVETANWVFTALPGMTLPAGARKNVCDDNNANCAGWVDVGATDDVAVANKVTKVAMEYFPATYYLKEACTFTGTDCVYAPDGTTTLKRYEIKSANYGTTAAFDTAIQNFANWFTYYRKRKLMLNASMGQVLEPLTGLRMGVVHFNNRPGAGTRVTMYDLDATTWANNGRKVAGIFYETNGSGGTPTRETLLRIGEEYAHASGPIKYACQRNNAFVVTDGFANVSNINPPAYSQATWGAGAPYETTYSKTLANLALGFYTINPRPLLATGKLVTDKDPNPDLHMNTYGMTIGSRGIAFQDEASLPPVSPANWTDPVAARHPSSVDDLWHATINGRGKMYLANTPKETAEKIQDAMDDIGNAPGAQAGVAVSTVNLARGDSSAYFGGYNPAGWSGDLTSKALDPSTAVLGATKWSASVQLHNRTWSTRLIASWNGSAGVSFSETEVGTTVNPGNVYGVTAEVIDYLRGDRTHQNTKFRDRERKTKDPVTGVVADRTELLGAIINSEPALDRATGVAYVQSGEGMLHAIDTLDPNGGKELWAFVPRSVLPNIGETARRGYVFGTQLDGSPVIGKIGGGATTMLVAGTGVAGRSFHAIDVTAPRPADEVALASTIKWEFPAFGDATMQSKVGHAMGKPLIFKTATDGDVVLVTSGYNNTLDGKGRLWMLNASTGTVIHEFEVAAGTLAAESGLAQIAVFRESDGTGRYAYGGDLLGNVWQFDLKDKTAPKLLAELKGPGGAVQPVTAAPEMLFKAGRRIVVIGTGRMLDIADMGNSEVRSIYVFADDGAALPDARLGLVKQTYNRATSTLTSLPVDWATDRGWYMDLSAGEQLFTKPAIIYGSLVFVSNVTGGSDCSASSYLYVLDALSGAQKGTTPVSAVLSLVANSFAPTVVVTDCTNAATCNKPIALTRDANDGNQSTELPPPGGVLPAKNAWREIRRQ